jgi:uncharacterized membrane protein
VAVPAGNLIVSRAAVRRLDIDWLRGIAVLAMILWHTVDAWTVKTGRDTAAFAVVIFVAGWAAPLFLFLAGVSVALAASARTARGLSRARASWEVQKRGWGIFLLAHLFRFQSFLLNPNGSWNSLLKPDILNVLGLGVVAAAVCWGRARGRGSLAAWLLGPAAAVTAVVTPMSRDWWWPTLLHPRLEAYIRPVGTFGVFTLFPAVAYVLVGAFVGALLAATDPQDDRLTRRIGLAGIILGLAGAIGSALPRPASITPAESVPTFLWMTGAMMAAMAVCAAILRWRPPRAWSPMIVFGQTSLFVYWIHVELAYGVFSYPIRYSLPLAWSLAAFALFTAFMFGCALLWQRRPRGPWIPEHMTSAKLECQSFPPTPS